MLGLGLSVTQLAVRGLRISDLAAAIRALFAAGEQGVWYDPSDLTTLYQDAAGTTPVTAVEQPVGLILDKSKGLVLGPELVTNGTFDTNTSGWGGLFGGSLTVSNYALRITNTIANGGAARQTIDVTPGKTYLIRYSVVTTSPYSRMTIGSTAGSGDYILITHSSKGNFTRLITATSTVLSFQPGSGSGVVGDYAEFDNISVRELPGNHATQTTSTSRPVLSARYNLLTKTEQFNDAAWSKGNVTVTANAITAPDGTLTADKLVENTGTSVWRYVYVHATGAVFPAVVSVWMKAAERTYGFIGDGQIGAVAVINLTDGSIVSSKAGYAPITVRNDGDGWFNVSITKPSAGVGASLWIGLADNSGNTSYTGDGTSGIYIWGASLVPANQSDLPYQRVNTSTDYDADPAKFPHYLRFDGVDDFLVTNSINFTATDKMTVFAGVRKLIDSNSADFILELSALINTHNGSFVLSGRDSFSPAKYEFVSKGTIMVIANNNEPAYAAPITNILTGIGDISGDRATLRINGTQAASSTADQGTGNFGAYPLYIGARAGTSLWFNGRIYSLIVRGAQSTEQQIIDAEKYVNDKTRAYA